MVVVYRSAARLHRTRWLFDQAEVIAARNPNGTVVFMVVLPSADPPDKETRAENSARLKKLGDKVRRVVTVPVGDGLRVNIVRTVMRALALIQGQAQSFCIANTIDEGLRRLREVATAETPSRETIVADLRRLYEALGETAPLTLSERETRP